MQPQGLRLMLGPDKATTPLLKWSVPLTPKAPQNPQASIWIPAYGGMRAGTVSCIIREISHWGNKIRFSAQDDDDHIGRARCKAATQFLNTPSALAGDVLLMVDHDIQWQPGDLAHIARKAVEKNAIVGGIYPKRAFGQGVPYRWKEEGDFTIGTDNLVLGEWVSTGFFAITRAILQAMTNKCEWICEGADPTGYWSFFIPYVVTTKHGREYLSEDWACCQTASDMGFKVYIDTLPKLVHEGWYGFRMVDTGYKPLPDQNVMLKVRDEDKVKEPSIVAAT